MRKALASIAALTLIAASSNAAAIQTTPVMSATGAAVSGVFTAGGKPAALTEVTAHKDDPIDGQPVTALVFTTETQNGDADANKDAWSGAFGDAIIVRVQPDGVIVGADMLHHGLDKTDGHLSVIGRLSLKDYREAEGQISGTLTSGGPVDAWGQQIDIDLTFRARAP